MADKEQITRYSDEELAEFQAIIEKKLAQTQEQLEKLAARPDLDTICAYDYQRMKNYALSGEGLKMNDWHPALRGIKEIPKMN